MKNKQLFNARGLTLIEIILTLALLGLITMVVYPTLSFAYKTSTVQLKESNQRNEVRAVWSHLKSDIEYSKDIELVDSTSLEVTNSKGEKISYYIRNSSSSEKFLVRENGAASEFKDIYDIEFEVLNEHLIKAKLYTDAESNKFTEFKIYRWHMTVDKPGNIEEIKDYIINNKVFVFGNQVKIYGSVYIDGPNASVIFRDPLDLNGGYISTKNIYVDGDINLGGNAVLGSTDKSSSIHVSGKILRNNNAELYGTIITGEDFELPKMQLPPLKPYDWYLERDYESGPIDDGIKYIGGDVEIKGGDKNFENVIIVSSGDITISSNINVTGILYAPNGNVDIGGNATFRGLILTDYVILGSNSHVTFDPIKLEDLPF